MKIDLTGKTAVVTGATGDLGPAMIRRLAECGANVAINYHANEAKANALKEEVEAKYGVKAFAVQADVTDLARTKEMKEKINSAIGHVDIIVNNAMVPCKWETVLEEPPEDYVRQFEFCVMQGVHMAKAFVPDMVEKRYGRVIGVNTECTMQMFEHQSAYASAKRGMDAIYRVLAREVGRHNVTVNEIAPGWILSERYEGADGSEHNYGQDFPYISRVPMGRRGTPDEVAYAVCFLASGLADFITGAYLPVCGGNVMPCV